MILQSQKEGVGHDSTYRNMNENRAPLTIMITLDENGHMVPGNYEGLADFISNLTIISRFRLPVCRYKNPNPSRLPPRNQKPC